MFRPGVQVFLKNEKDQNMASNPDRTTHITIDHTVELVCGDVSISLSPSKLIIHGPIARIDPTKPEPEIDPVAQALPQPHVLRCGKLRREPDGSWWYDDMLIGHDGDPKFPDELYHTLALASLRLARALQHSVEQLQRTGNDASAAAPRDVLARFIEYRRTGYWPDEDATVPLLLDFSVAEILDKGVDLLNQLFAALSDDAPTLERLGPTYGALQNWQGELVHVLRPKDELDA